MRKALVTVLIGETYQRQWRERFSPTWQAYAARHGYDIVVIDDYIDPSPMARARSPHWQKCLILEHPKVRGYDRVVWVDADVLINPYRAPCIVAATPPGKVGAVSHNRCYRRSANTIATVEDRYNHMLGATSGAPQGKGMAPAELYRHLGLADGVDDMVNTGVLVLEPAHAPLLRQVYDTGQEAPLSSFEMMPLCHALFSADAVAFLDDAFNVIYPFEITTHYAWAMHAAATQRDWVLATNNIWINSYFLHFTSGSLRDHAAMVVVQAGGLDALALAMDWLARRAAGPS